MNSKVRLFSEAALVVMACATAVGQTISSFEPTYGAYGDPNYIIIHGTSFSPGVSVKIGGAYATTVLPSGDGTQITTQVPSGAALGSSSITVQNPGGSPVSSLDSFTVIGPGPYIDHFDPRTGNAGTTVTIYGAHFVNPITVKFNNISVSATTAYADHFTVQAPAGVTSGPISVTTSGGSWTNDSNFVVPPVITGFSPASGRTGTNVVLTGTNFIGTIAVRFNPPGWTNLATFSVVNNNKLQVTVPTNAITGPIRLDNLAAQFTTVSNFVVLPTIYDISPVAGPVGTAVTITGANLNAGTPVVTFNGVSATISGTPAFGQLTAVAPDSTTGPVSVQTTNGTAVSSTTFYYPAILTSVAPNHGVAGTKVVIHGTNFLGATNVSFNGIPAQFVVSNNTTIGATAPEEVTSGRITIDTPAGTGSSSNVLFYLAPVITGFSPTHGLPGAAVTIVGTNFTGTTAVKFGGVNSQFTVADNNQISAIVPTNAQTGPITVAAPGGTNTTAENFVLDYLSDLNVTISDTPDPVFVGSNLVYSINVYNNGPFAAPNVMLSDTLPASVSLQSFSGSQGTLETNGNFLTGTLGTITNGRSVAITLNVIPHAVATITNSVSVSSDNVDPTLANNTALAVTAVWPLPLIAIQALPQNQIRLSWPTQFSDYTLQSAPVLGKMNAWSNLTVTPTTSGSDSVVVRTNNGTNAFFRLKN